MNTQKIFVFIERLCRKNERITCPVFFFFLLENSRIFFWSTLIFYSALDLFFFLFVWSCSLQLIVYKEENSQSHPVDVSFIAMHDQSKNRNNLVKNLKELKNAKTLKKKVKNNLLRKQNSDMNFLWYRWWYLSMFLLLWIFSILYICIFLLNRFLNCVHQITITFIYVNFMYWLDYFKEGHRVISCT